jgi:hypothetical protein
MCVSTNCKEKSSIGQSQNSLSLIPRKEVAMAWMCREQPLKRDTCHDIYIDMVLLNVQCIIFGGFSL